MFLHITDTIQAVFHTLDQFAYINYVVVFCNKSNILVNWRKN